MVSDAAWIIEIHGATASDLSIESEGGVVEGEGRGTERGRTEQGFGCRLCHFLLGEANPGDPPSVANGQNTHTCTHTHRCTPSNGERCL